MDIFVIPAQDSDMEKIKLYLDEYGLDNENLDYRQFYIAGNQAKQLVGFGRIKQYDDIYEIASVGVIDQFRGYGIGKKIVEKLINIVPSEEIWITTVIPEYFEQFGFVEDDNIPDAILLKCQRICKKLNKTTKNSHYMCCRKADFFNN